MDGWPNRGKEVSVCWWCCVDVALVHGGRQLCKRSPFSCSQVLEVIAGSRGEDAEQLAEVIYDNTRKLFFS